VLDDRHPREQSQTRRRSPIVQEDHLGLIKIARSRPGQPRTCTIISMKTTCPITRCGTRATEHRFQPEEGFCTTRVKPGEDPRSGRWAGIDKTECGLHVHEQGAESDPDGSSPDVAAFVAAARNPALCAVGVAAVSRFSALVLGAVCLLIAEGGMARGEPVSIPMTQNAQPPSLEPSPSRRPPMTHREGTADRGPFDVHALVIDETEEVFGQGTLDGTGDDASGRRDTRFA